VPKFIRVTLIICLVLTAVPGVLFASLWLWSLYQTAKVDSFYRENRLLGAMRDGQKESTNDSASARDALLKVVPLGTDKDTVVAFLRKEGLGCRAIAEPVTHAALRKSFLEARGMTDSPNDSRPKKQWVDCQRQAPNLMGYAHWIVDVEFDADARLSDARVAIWNIFF